MRQINPWWSATADASRNLKKRECKHVRLANAQEYLNNERNYILVEGMTMLDTQERMTGREAKLRNAQLEAEFIAHVSNRKPGEEKKRLRQWRVINTDLIS